MNLTDKAHMDLYKFLTEKGALSLLDYLFLEKLFRNYSYENYGDRNLFINARNFESSCNEEIHYFYDCPAFIWFYENPIFSCFHDESEISSRLKYYKSLGIIELKQSGKNYSYRFSKQATELFQNYLDSIE